MKKRLVTLLCVGLTAALSLTVMGCSRDGDDFADAWVSAGADLAEQSMPSTGELIESYNGSRDSQLTITASEAEAAYVKLKTTAGSDVLSFFVRPGETANVAVPAGDYYVYFASGETWYGPNDCFGSDTAYGMCEDLLDFTNYTWTFELTRQTNGNWSEKSISASDF